MNLTLSEKNYQSKSYAAWEPEYSVLGRRHLDPSYDFKSHMYMTCNCAI